MTARNQARRRKGSHRQVKYSNGAEMLAEIREADLADDAERERSRAEKTIDYWQAVEHKPLFVYFIIEAPTYYDYVGLYTIDEYDEDENRVQTAALRAVKIGKAFNPRQRLRELGCGNPRGLILEHVVLANENTERRLHQHWGGAGIKGEWYGARYYDAILAMAAVIADAQIEAHKAGENMHYITEHIPLDVATNRLGKEAV